MNTSPAPWSTQNTSGWTALIVDADGKMVARTQHRANGPDNALLLAAAPALRDMLRRVEELLRKSGMACNCDGCRYCTMAAEIRTILASLGGDTSC